MKKSNCGGKGSFDFIKVKNIIEKAPFVNPKKLNKLWKDIDTKCCLIHDNAFLKGGNIIDFIKANHEFGVNVMKLLHWSVMYVRVNVYIILFLGTTLFGWKFFNFK